MSPSTRLPTIERRRQIAEAALRIIADRGVRRLTAAALAEEVGIADGTIFRHFATMDEVALAAIERFEERLESTFPPETLPPLERLGAFFTARLALVRADPTVLRLAFNDRLAEAAGDEGAARVGRVVVRSMAFVHRCLAEARERGEIPGDASPSLLLWMVVGAIRGAAGAGVPPGVEARPLAGRSPAAVWRELERFLRAARPGAEGAGERS